jgi:hypothetical protein
MDAGTLALLIPIFALCIPIIAIWTQHQRKLAELQLSAAAERSAQFANSNRELEERVRVLERIVTDGGYDVGAQIDALRDTREVEAPRDLAPLRETRQ